MVAEAAELWIQTTEMIGIQINFEILKSTMSMRKQPRPRLNPASQGCTQNLSNITLNNGLQKSWCLNDLLKSEGGTHQGPKRIGIAILVLQPEEGRLDPNLISDLPQIPGLKPNSLGAQKIAGVISATDGKPQRIAFEKRILPLQTQGPRVIRIARTRGGLA